MIYKSRIPRLWSILHGAATILDGLILLLTLGFIGASFGMTVIETYTRRRIRNLQSIKNKSIQGYWRNK